MSNFNYLVIQFGNWVWKDSNSYASLESSSGCDGAHNTGSSKVQKAFSQFEMQESFDDSGFLYQSVFMVLSAVLVTRVPTNGREEVKSNSYVNWRRGWKVLKIIITSSILSGGKQVIMSSTYLWRKRTWKLSFRMTSFSRATKAKLTRMGLRLEPMATLQV